MTIALTGSDVKLMWGKETAYGTPVTADKVFGVCPSLQSWTITRNQNRRYGLGNREACTINEGNTEYAVEVEFQLTSDASVFELPLSKTSGTPTDKWEADSTQASATIMATFLDDAGAVVSYQFAGCLVTAYSVDTSEGEPVDVSMSFVCKSITEGTTAITPAYTLAGLTYADASITIGTDTSTTIQSFTISAETGAGNVYGIGSRLPGGRSFGNYEYSVSIEHIRNTDINLASLADSAPFDVELEISTGATTSMTFTLKGCSVDSYDTSATGEDEVTETLELIAKRMEVSIA